MTDDAPVAGWLPCSDRSRERDDPLAGTGSRGEQWFLVEVANGWGPRVFLDAPFDAGLGRAIVDRAEAAGVRPLAIRRPGRRPPQRAPESRWFFIDSRPGFETVRTGTVARYEELLEVPLNATPGTEWTAPLFCVCAHGRHDQCCAVRGRQVATELAAAYPDETWECSHVGGDRFAGTMVLFPEGLYYGRLDDADVIDIAERHAAGRVDERFLRGRSSLSHPVQAAQHFARLAAGVDTITSFAPIEQRATEDGWLVTLEDPSGSVAVRLVTELSAPLLSTCAATRFTRVRQLELAGIERL
jgi:hypothetical protein